MARDLLILARSTLSTPDLAMRQLRSLDLPLEARWMGLVLAAALSTLLTFAGFAMLPAATDPMLMVMGMSPWNFAILQLTGLAICAALLAVMGRTFGGQGDFADSLLVIAWLQLLYCAVQAVQLVLLMILPVLSSLFGVAALVVMLWVTVQMVRALHGFSSNILVLLGLLAGGLLAIVLASVLAALLGLTPEIPQEMLE